jgi:ubiquinone/menaquinone biosynthesis C-methylase UbiE
MSEIAYLDRAAASDAGRAYKARVLELLSAGRGQVALDVGCGTGADLGELAQAVGPAGAVIGVDHDPVMVAEAARRYAGVSYLDIRAGDAHQLPVADHSVDRVRIDRVLQHVSDPAAVLAQVRRVLRPGGLVALADNDWDTLVVDDVDTGTSRAYTRYVATEVVRNATIGRQLARLADGAGLTVREVVAQPVVFTDHAAADAILRFAYVAARAVAEGFLAEDAANAWLDRLAAGRTFLATFTFFIVLAESR